MKIFPLLAAGVMLLLCVPVNAAPSSGDEPPTLAPQKGVKWSLSVAFARVAIGGIPSEAHQTPFTLRASDAKGKPLAGVLAALPQIRNSLGHMEPDKERGIVSARVAWLGTTPIPVTDAKGEIRGLFTSGGVEETVTLLVPSAKGVDIEQVWNDVEDPNGDGVFSIPEGTTPVDFSMGLKRGDKMLPIVGHHLNLEIDAITFTAIRRTGKVDEQGIPETEENSFDWKIKNPGDEGSALDKARWEFVKQFVTSAATTEGAPGQYHSWYTTSFPSSDAPGAGVVLENCLLTGVSDVDSATSDNDAHDSEIAPRNPHP